MSNKKVQNWSVQGIDEKIKNKFCAKAKEKGINIPRLLEIVLAKYLKEGQAKNA